MADYLRPTSLDAALAALEGLPASEAGAAEAQQYRVLCLLALGRTVDAQRAAEVLVEAAPTVIPSAEEFPPRFITLFTDTRRRLLPEIVSRVFADARNLYKENKRSVSCTQANR